MPLDEDQHQDENFLTKVKSMFGAGFFDSVGGILLTILVGIPLFILGLIVLFLFVLWIISLVAVIFWKNKKFADFAGEFYTLWLL